MSVVEWERSARALSGDIRLNGDGVDVVVGDGLVAFEEELSITGSPIVRVGVLDPDRTLVDSGLLDLRSDDAEQLDREVELVVDGVVYWLRSVSKRGDMMELTFEDRTVCRMRDKGQPMKQSAGAADHRAFVKRLCALAGVEEPVVRTPGPEERRAREQSGVGTSRARRARQRRAADDRREPGIASGARLRVKSAWASPAQLDVASQLLEKASELGASDKVMVALIAVAIQESFLTNLRSPSEDGYGSYGVLQPRVGYSNSHKGTVTMAQALDVAFNAEAFLRDPGWASKGGAMRWDRLRPDWSIGEIGEMVEQGPSPSTYNQWESQARAIVEKFKGGGLSYGDRSSVREAPLAVERDESYWDAALRIADAYGFRFFVVSNVAYYLADEALLASRPLMTLGEETPGVHELNWEWAPRKELRQTDVTCNVRAWAAPPGSVVELDEDCGPAAGRWLVGEYARSRFEQTAEVTLVKGRRPLVPTVTVEQRERSGGGAKRGKDGKVSADARAIGDGYFYPLAQRGRFLGGPGEGTHDWSDPPNNWQSDNAIDIEVPIGTDVLAVRDGTITRVGGSWNGGADRMDGFRIYLAADDGTLWWYTHLKQLLIQERRRVRGGQVIGKSGAANSAPHLHIAIEKGDPMARLGFR